MKLLYDSQIFHLQRLGGISRLFVELFKQLEINPAVTWQLALDYPENDHIKSLEAVHGPITRYSRFLGGKKFRGKGRLFSFWDAFTSAKNEQARVFEQLQESSVDLFHPTYYDDYFLGMGADVPFVVTVYDMIHELFPDTTEPEWRAQMIISQKRTLVRKASRVIAISNKTKQDLIRLNGIKPETIDVVPLANSLIIETTSEELSDQPEDYLLFVGQREGYKNFHRLVRAIGPIIRQHRRLRFVCIGGRKYKNGFSEDEKKALLDEGITEQTLLRSASDGQLRAWYSGARCLLFPSLYEGFGLPLLEAFSCGCPVVASSAGALPEVGGRAVAYFDPYSVEHMRDSIVSVLQSTEKRDELVELGFERLAKFSWQHTAQLTLESYRKACSH